MSIEGPNLEVRRTYVDWRWTSGGMGKWPITCTCYRWT